MHKIKMFLIDHLDYFILYFLSNFFIILYSFLKTNTLDILYPLGISLFILVIFSSIKYYHYQKFIHSLHQVVQNNLQEVIHSNQKEKAVGQVIKELHSSYLNQINTLKVNLRNKNLFISNWVHHIKTPISVIDLMLQKLQNGEKVDLDEMRVENKKLIQNLEQILSLIRLEDFKQDYHLETICLHQFINELINERKKEFIYQKIYPIVLSEQNEYFITSDQKWLKVIINQIINNALKYSVAHKKLMFKIVQNKQYIHLSIIDQGIGIPEYDLYRIFEPFFTGTNGRKVESSSGIGLYLVKQVCDKLQHQIEIKSELEKGTEVVLTFLAKM